MADGPRARWQMRSSFCLFKNIAERVFGEVRNAANLWGTEAFVRAKVIGTRVRLVAPQYSYSVEHLPIDEARHSRNRKRHPAVRGGVDESFADQARTHWPQTCRFGIQATCNVTS